MKLSNTGIVLIMGAILIGGYIAINKNKQLPVAAAPLNNTTSNPPTTAPVVTNPPNTVPITTLPVSVSTPADTFFYGTPQAPVVTNPPTTAPVTTLPEFTPGSTVIHSGSDIAGPDAGQNVANQYILQDFMQSAYYHMGQNINTSIEGGSVFSPTFMNQGAVDGADWFHGGFGGSPSQG